MRLWVPLLSVLLVQVSIAQDLASGPDITGTYQGSQRDLVRAAQVKRAEGDLEEASRLLTNAHQMAKGHVETLLALAEVTLERGNVELAERQFAQILKLRPDHQQAKLGLIDAMSHARADTAALERALKIAQQLAEQRTFRREALIRVATIQSHQGLEAEARETWQRVLSQGALSDRDKLKLGDFYRTFNHLGDAIRWYSDCESAICSQRLRRLNRSVPLSAMVHTALHTQRPAPELSIARSMIRRGQFANALKLLEELAKRRPTDHHVQALLGDTRVQTGRRGPAESAYIRAIALGGHTIENYLRLADYYVAEASVEAGRRRLSTHYLGQAYQLNPQNPEVTVRYAEGLFELKAYESAYQLATQAFNATPPRAILVRLESLRERLEQTGTIKVSSPEAEHGAKAPLTMAQGLRARGETRAALEVLSRIPITERSQRDLMELGALSRELERPRDAISYYTQASSLTPDAPEPNYELGVTYLSLGLKDQAYRALQDAHSKGAQAAELLLCKHWVINEGKANFASDVLHARSLRRCQDQLETMGSDPAYLARKTEIQSLLEVVNGRLASLYAVAGVSLLSCLLLVGVIIRRRFSGYTVEEFINLKPTAAPAVQRLLSAIRHEILKHNTTALTGLLDAIRAGEQITERALWCEESLFGSDSTADQSAFSRLEDYMDELCRLGRSHDLRLNLKVVDPTFKALLAGFEQLERLLPKISHAASSPPPPPGLVRQLNTACEQINGVGLRGIIALLESLRVTQVDRELLHDIFDGIRHEPAFRSQQVEPLALEGGDNALPFQVAITLHEFEDILRNPMRNAIEASVDAAQENESIAVGLEVQRIIEPITGLMSVELRIKDRSPNPLDPELLQSQHVERGLGLAFRILIEHEGTISVAEERAPWCKAVVIGLPIVEMESEWAL